LTPRDPRAKSTTAFVNFKSPMQALLALEAFCPHVATVRLTPELKSMPLSAAAVIPLNLRHLYLVVPRKPRKPHQQQHAPPLRLRPKMPNTADRRGAEPEWFGALWVAASSAVAWASHVLSTAGPDPTAVVAKAHAAVTDALACALAANGGVETVDVWRYLARRVVAAVLGAAVALAEKLAARRQAATGAPIAAPAAGPVVVPSDAALRGLRAACQLLLYPGFARPWVAAWVARGTPAPSREPVAAATAAAAVVPVVADADRVLFCELRAALRCAGARNEHKWCGVAARVLGALRDAVGTAPVANIKKAHGEYAEARRALTAAYTCHLGAPLLHAVWGVLKAEAGRVGLAAEHPGY
jgi:hypothetical protein